MVFKKVYNFEKVIMCSTLFGLIYVAIYLTNGPEVSFYLVLFWIFRTLMSALSSANVIWFPILLTIRSSVTHSLAQLVEH